MIGKNVPQIILAKVSALNIICIENDKLRSLSFQDIINDITLRNHEK
jgi:hypothetical protein